VSGELDTQKIRLIMQLRSEGITDMRVLAALERVPRERFVPPSLAEHAYDNSALPIGRGQTISQPFVVAYMTQMLDVHDDMTVLEIGTGTGYQAAVLAQFCRRVYTVERHRAILRDAEMRFAKLGVGNITTRYGDGTKGWPDHAPYDRIMVTAGAPVVPPALVGQLADDGVMVLPIGPDPLAQELVRVRRTADGHELERLIGVRFVPLVAGDTDDDED
jgi:protein-L-isoaspartate(D-aspartate) O-methyltransferase